MFSVVYTTLGGIRAVIWTDVIQCFVLMLGAFFTMGAIAYMTDSGIGDWLAVAQEYKHEEVRWFDWDPRTRSTVFTISLGMFFWFVCTHGANQVALQRYFSVKDVRAARQSYVVSALASIFIGVILAGVGIALLYYIQQPGVLVSDLPAKAGIESAVSSIRNEAQDAVFPQFIGRLIPSGLRGLVVAALFAAAMSTIDSGANSVSTILTVDFFRRLKPEWTSESGELFRARLFTASMGVIVVGYTVLIYHISKGTDIISLCQKGFNCFLGPLGALFFMGMLYKRATPATVLPAFLIGEVVGVLTSFSTDLFDIPFSTHLVIPASCLLTCLLCVLFSEATRSLARPAQLQMMWKPIVKSNKTASLD
jgi:SSS family solute:Na+ symporter